jgi:hypothetical protein
MEVAYDPGSNDLIATITIADGKEIGIKGGGSASVRIPYQTVMSTPELSELAKMIPKNSITYDSPGIFSELAQNPYATIQSPTYMSNTGFDFSARGTNDINGGYGLVIDYSYFDNEIGAEQTGTEYVPMVQGDNKTLNELETSLNTLFMQVAEQKSVYNDSKSVETTTLPKR